MLNQPWTEEEEDMIVFNAGTNSLVQPFTRWSGLAQQGILPSCTRKRIRDWWLNHLNPNLNLIHFRKMMI
jgi:hypothetical protein